MPKPTLRQTTLPFKQISEAKYQAQEKRQAINLRAKREEEEERLRQTEIQKKLRKKTYKQERKRIQRAQKRQAKQELMRERQDLPQFTQPKCDSRATISALSQPYSTINTAVNNPNSHKPRKHKGTIHMTQQINWCQELLWKTIDSNSRAVGFPWSPTSIINRLWKIDPQTFQYLQPQRISQWQDHQYPNELRWTESQLWAVAAGSRSGQRIGQKGIFHNRPDVVEIIKKCLLSFRQAGICLNLKTIRGYIVGIIQHYMPEAFSRIGRLELGWSIQKATRAAQKYPPNVNKVLLDAFLRMACTVRNKAVPACCIVNANQTQIVYNSSDQRTWNATRERQIDVVGIKDKRGFTLLVSASLAGDVLPFQAVYTGKTKRSVPDSTSPGYSEAMKLGFLLDYSKSDTYWSNLETMQRWVRKILEPYFVSQREKHGLPPSQRCILQIDSWSVHRSEKFLTWMANNYPWIDIKFVPAGCTGLFQACDVGIQRILKVAIQNTAHADIVAETVGVLMTGIKPQHVVNDQSLATLRRRSVNWILQGFHAVNQPNIIKKAFALCAVPETPFNLSYESLNGRDARRALNELLATDPQFFAEITSRKTMPLPSTFNNESELPFSDTNHDDDSNPTVEEIEDLILNAEVAQEVSNPYNDSPELEEDDHDDEDDPVDPLPVPVTTTRSGRRSRPSTRYSRNSWDGDGDDVF
ncbi:hypothetical protein RHS03_06352, partial [Rhizoctonia solani]